MQNKILTFLFIALTIVLPSGVVSAEEPVAVPATAPTAEQLIIKKMRDEIIDLRKELAIRDTEANKAQVEYTKKYYSYLSDKTDIYIDQFRWQRSASERLLWLVVTVVISGIIFSGVQLWRASSIKDLGGESTIEIEASKIKVTSSVVGLAVLIISIVFFYFFLTEVYTVKIVDMTSAETKPQLPVQNARQAAGQ
ncbi:MULTISPECIES: hypothetical protein [unclassified Pseudomonas]|uniref:hypothetical protein n=1 Tax=unclassified Pseudomonas TaxID=196821 RepID=UPI000A1EBE25|nr:MULTISPECIES: hypothetical protein [unclassified Pseudomonas]